MIRAGRLGYAAAEELQKKTVARRQTGEIPDVLLLLEHPAVITLGRNAKRENLLWDEAALAARGVAVAECDRGGDVTFHGPGQLVGYPIFDLRGCARPSFLPPRSGRLELGPVDFVRALEEVLIRVAAAAGVACKRLPGLTGVWTEAAVAQPPFAGAALPSEGLWPGVAPRQRTPALAHGVSKLPRPERKLAAIGIHVARGVTSHGFALNVNNDLAGFDCIIPCGIRDRGVTSLARETGREWTLEEAATLVEREFLSVFARNLADTRDLWDDTRL